jgi:polar amino acid transport system permease protein
MNTTVLPFGVESSHAAAAPPAVAPPARVAAAGPHRYAHLRVVPARYPARTVGTVLAVLLLGLIAHSVITNEKWGWPVFAEWFFDEAVLVGLGRTLLLTVLSAALGFSLGTLLALARVSGSTILSSFSFGYVWLFRSIPPLVLLLLINNLGYLYETVTIGVPLTHWVWFSVPTTQLLSPFAAAIVGLTLNQSAYAAEIIRGGILSVDPGQHEAAAALGLSRPRQAWRIVLPQAMRSILPNGFNAIIGLTKGTSVVYVLALPELFYTIQVIYRRNLEVIPLLMVATAWYLVILTVLSLIQRQIERHFARGALREGGRSTRSLRSIRSRAKVAATREAAPSVASVAVTTREAVPASGDVRTATPAPDGVAVAAWGASPVPGGEITVHGVSKQYGALRVLDEVSLTIPAGAVTVILGPSGSGKSTLLRSINHLERVDEGFIALDGELIAYRQIGDTLHELRESEILRRRADIGMVFQGFHLFPHMTVLQNLVEAPVSVRGVLPAEAEARARLLLARVGLADKADAYPRQLSGGQQQRVAIARAMALQPKVLLFDEPTSALDPELVGEVLAVIRELARSGTTLVVVTHELAFAREVADQVVFMEQGRVVEIGHPDQLFDRPTQARTATFLASSGVSLPLQGSSHDSTTP